MAFGMFGHRSSGDDSDASPPTGMVTSAAGVGFGADPFSSKPASSSVWGGGFGGFDDAFGTAPELAAGTAVKSSSQPSAWVANGFDTLDSTAEAVAAGASVSQASAWGATGPGTRSNSAFAFSESSAAIVGAGGSASKPCAWGTSCGAGFEDAFGANSGAAAADASSGGPVGEQSAGGGRCDGGFDAFPATGEAVASSSQPSPWSTNGRLGFDGFGSAVEAKLPNGVGVFANSALGASGFDGFDASARNVAAPSGWGESCGSGFDADPTTNGAGMLKSTAAREPLAVNDQSFHAAGNNGLGPYLLESRASGDNVIPGSGHTGPIEDSAAEQRSQNVSLVGSSLASGTVPLRGSNLQDSPAVRMIGGNHFARSPASTFPGSSANPCAVLPSSAHLGSTIKNHTSGVGFDRSHGAASSPSGIVDKSSHLAISPLSEKVAQSLAAKLPLARQHVAELDDDLNLLESDVSTHASAADACLDDLRTLAEALLVDMSNRRSASEKQVLAATQRRDDLEEEICTMQRRLGTSAPDCHQSVVAEEWRRCANGIVTVARSANVEYRDGPDVRIIEELQRCKAHLAALRRSSSGLQARLACDDGTASATNPTLWVSRYEAMVAVQGALVDRTAAAVSDAVTQDLDFALGACPRTLQDIAIRSREGVPEHLVSTTRCMQGLAAAERRRRGMLTERWRSLEDAIASPPASLQVASYRLLTPGMLPRSSPLSSSIDSQAQARRFSPPRTLDWEMDVSRRRGLGSDERSVRAGFGGF